MCGGTPEGISTAPSSAISPNPPHSPRATGNITLELAAPAVLEYFTAEQAEELQELPLGYTASVSEKQRFRLVGNTWPLEVITHILSAVPAAAHN